MQIRDGVLVAVGIGIGAIATSWVSRRASDESDAPADATEAVTGEEGAADGHKGSALQLEPLEDSAPPADEDVGLDLATHNRYTYSGIVERNDYSWPGGKRLAVYFAINLEHFEFGKGMGAKLGGQ